MKTWGPGDFVLATDLNGNFAACGSATDVAALQASVAANSNAITGAVANVATLQTSVAANSNAITGTAATVAALLARESKHVSMFGAKGDGVTDDTAAIQAAINSLATRGGELRFAAADYLVKTSLLIQANGIKLRGAGRGAFHDSVPNNPGTTRLLWGGATNGTAMVVFQPGSAAAQKLTDVGMTGIELHGTPAYTSGPTASYGLLLYSVQHSDFDLHTAEFATAAVATGVKPANEAANCEGITLSLRFRQINQAGTALQLGGSSTGNTCFCHFRFIYGYINKGTGIDFQNCDGNTFGQVWIDSIGPDAGRPRSIVFRGQTNSGGSFPYGGGRANTIDHFSGSIHNNLVYSEGTETANVTVPAYANRILFFDNANAALTAQTGTGASFYWSGNMNPTGMQDANLDPNNGHITFSNGYTQFWGSTALLGAHTSSTLALPFSCTRIISVQATPLGTSDASSAVGVVGCYGFGPQPSNPASQQFSLYAPCTAYYSYTGVCLR